MTQQANGTRVVVVGGANTDYLIRGNRLPEPGETVEGKAFQQAPGGKGANQAVAVARLGMSVAFITVASIVGMTPQTSGEVE